MRVHAKFFLLFNALYFVPLFALAVSGIEQSGIGDISHSRAVLPQIIAVYALGVTAFLFGSTLHGMVSAALGRKAANVEVAQRRIRWNIGLPEKLTTGVIVAIYLLFKILLIPLGVYQSYAFDQGSMTGGVWTSSMALSEALLLIALIFLFSEEKHNVAWYLILSAINSINLLHGSRIFFIVSVLGLLFYFYQKKKVTLVTLAITATAVILLSYLVFVLRSHIDAADTSFDLIHVTFPIVAESVFSQLSLIEVLRQHLWTPAGHLLWFYADVVSFVIPRALFPDKDSFQFIARYDSLSPLGAFSGYAQGLLYLGFFFPAFYFVLGLTADWLRRRALSNAYWMVLYAYFTSDFLFRVMRDGYIIPIKMLLDAVILACAMIIISKLFVYLPKQQYAAPENNLTHE